jgi:hypothetical protein
MPVKDIYHSAARQALVADGWTITHDPLVLKFGSRDMYVDLGAERLLAAQKGEVKIAIEVKSFLGPSVMHDLEQAIGQFILYHDVLAEREPDRILYLAMPGLMMDMILEEPIGQLLLRNERIRVLLFDPEGEVVIQWIPEQPIEKSPSVS